MMQPRYGALMTANLTEEPVYPSVGAQICQWGFNILVPTVMLWQFFNEAHGSTIDIATFAKFLVLIALVECYRLVLAFLLNYAFRLDRYFGSLYLRYLSVRMVFTIGLLILALLPISSSVGWQLLFAWLTICIGYTTISWRKLMNAQTYSIIYILLFLITAEILPWAAFYVYSL